MGKTKLAIKLAMEMQCPDETQLVTRKMIAEGTSPDTLLFLDEGSVFPIESVRRIVERTGLTHLSPYLIFVIENIGRMKLEALNALLKTLEEPPEGVYFFLTAHNEEAVIPTIRSRVHTVRFNTVSDPELKAACEGETFAEEMVMFAMGRPGKLIRLKENPDYFKAHQDIHINVTRFLEDPSTGNVFELVRQYEKSEWLPELLDLLLHRVRTFALSRKRSTLLSHLDFTEVLDEIEQTKRDLKNNVNKKLLLENLLLPFTS